MRVLPRHGLRIVPISDSIYFWPNVSVLDTIRLSIVAKAAKDNFAAKAANDQFAAINIL
jgi:hypothetical protein